MPSERANELADEFVRLQAEVNVLEDSLDARGLGSRSAMARLDAARQDLAAAEKAVQKPELTEQDRVELEAAHDAVLEFGGKGRRGGKKRLEEAMAHEQEILDRIGFPTWSAYVMGSGLMAIDSSAERNLELARNELEEAELHWSNVAAMIEADPTHGELLDKLESVYLEAFDLLGGDDEQDDLESKLRNLLVPKREVSVDELVDALAYQLELVGMTIPAQSVTLDRTVMIADAFLEEVSAITERLNELGNEKVAALTELETLDDELGALDREATEIAAAEAARAAHDDLDLDADLELDSISTWTTTTAPPTSTRTTEPSGPSEDDLARLEAELDALVEEEQEYVEFVEAREALVDHAIQIESVAAAKLRKIANDLTDQHNAAAAAAAEAGPRSSMRPRSSPVASASRNGRRRRRSSSTCWRASPRSDRCPTPARSRWSSTTPSPTCPSATSSTSCTSSSACRSRCRSCTSATIRPSAPGRAASGSSEAPSSTRRLPSASDRLPRRPRPPGQVRTIG